MAIINASLDTTATIFKTDYVFGGSNASITSNTKPYFLSSKRPLNASGYDSSYVQVRYCSKGTTDALEIYVLTSYNNASADFTDFGRWSMSASKTTASRDLDFTVSDAPYYRLGFLSSGGTDEHGVWVRCTRRKWASS